MCVCVFGKIGLYNFRLELAFSFVCLFQNYITELIYLDVYVKYTYTHIELQMWKVL